MPRSNMEDISSVRGVESNHIASFPLVSVKMIFRPFGNVWAGTEKQYDLSFSKVLDMAGESHIE